MEKGRWRRDKEEDLEHRIRRKTTYLYASESWNKVKVRVVGKKNALFSGNQHFAHCLDLTFECVAIIIFTPFVEDRISSMATATHGEWYGDKRENTFLTTRCEAPVEEKESERPARDSRG